MKIIKHIFLSTILLFLTLLGFSQLKPKANLTQSELSLYEISFQEFFDEDYLSANQGFSQLVSLYPGDEIFNYYYGACLVKLASNPGAGIKFLEIAAKKGVNPANFYIGLAYHFQYEFDKALEYYQLYTKNAKQKDIVNFEVKQYINMANNGKELVKYANELKLISLKKVDRKNFHYSYNLDDFGGNIIVKTEQFRTKADRKILEIDLMYISEKHNVLFFSSYGDSKKNSLDLYISRKEKGAWTNAQKLPLTINTEYDEAFPFLSDDGKTLYFSSKGHNSMGNYDIFKSIWDEDKNQWSAPENLDFPINTPFDDILYAVDKFNETAFFSSARESKTNEIAVYRILIENNPLRRKINSVNDMLVAASPSVSNLAIRDLSYKQEQRLSLADTLKTDKVEKVELPVNDIDLAILKIFEDLENVSQNIFQNKQYAAAANKLSNEKILEIKNLNNELSKLKLDKTNQYKTRINEINEQINNLSNEAIVLYDIAKYFYDFTQRAEGLHDYYLSEAKILDKTSREEPSLGKSVKLIQIEINKMDNSFPLDKYLEDLNKEIISASEKLEKFNDTNRPLFSELEKLNNKISAIIEICRNEPEFELREKYIYDIKTYENQKIDLISKIKENNVQIEFIKYDVNEANSKIDQANLLLGEVENNLFTNPKLNLSIPNTDIETINTHKTQNSLKELVTIQEQINNDLSLYSPIVDYDAILYGDDLVNRDKQLFIDINDYSTKYDEYILPETKIIGEKIFANDTLKENIKNLENQFDKTDSDIEKQNIISEINKTQIQINQNKTIIRESSNEFLPVDNTVNTNSLEKIKIGDDSSNYRNEIAEIDKLMKVSEELSQNILDFKVLDKNTESLDLWFLELIKHDIDKNIENKIEKLEKLIENEKPLTNIQELIAELKPKLSNNQERINQSKLIINEFEKAKSLFVLSENVQGNKEKNEYMSQANILIEQNLLQTIDFLNNSLLDFYSDFILYTSYLENYNLIDKRAKPYFEKAKNFKQIADSLQIVAEESNSGAEVRVLLGEAYKSIELANLNLSYIFEFLNNSSKYLPNKIFSNRVESLNFIKEINTIKTKELLEEEIQLIFVEQKSEKLEKLIQDSEQNQNRIEELTSQFVQADTERKEEILKEIEVLNTKIEQQISEFKEEIARIQKQLIEEKFAEISTKGNNDDIDKLRKAIDKFTEGYNNYYNSKDYFLLGEVIVFGEKIIKTQNELSRKQNSLIIPQEKIDKIIFNSNEFKTFVTRETYTLEQEKLLAEQTNKPNLENKEINETDNTIETNKKILENIENQKSENLFNAENDETLTIEEQSLTQNEKNNENIENQDLNREHIQVNDLNLAQNTKNDNALKESQILEDSNEPIIKTSEQNQNISDVNITDKNVANTIYDENEIFKNEAIDLSELINLISTSEANQDLIDKSKELELNQNKIYQNQSKISELNYNIKNSKSKKSQEKLKTEKSKLENSQLQLLKEQSLVRANILIELNDNFMSNNPELQNDESYNELVSDYLEQRNSIIQYNNFYSNNELFELFEKANQAENLIIKTIINNSNNENLASLAKSYETDKQPINNKDSNKKIEYNSDKYYNENLSKLENKLIAINNEIAKYDEQINNYEKLMIESSKFSDYKKYEKSMTKIGNQKVQSIKDYAVIAKEYYILEYELRENYYSGNLEANDEIVEFVADSLRKIANKNFEELILTYDNISSSKNSVEEILKNYDKSKNCLNNSFETMDLVNTIITYPDKEDEILKPYYKYLEITEPVDETSLTDLKPLSEGTADKEFISENIEDKPIKNINVIDEQKVKLVETSLDFFYRIQFAASNIPVDEGKFSELLPIFHENIENSRLIRFMTGTYSRLSLAREDLPRVKQKSFNDAFIVAYYNEKRISIAEALELENQLNLVVQEKGILANKESETLSSQEKSSEISANKLEEKLTPENYYEQELSKTKETFYCIQVGVYRERISSERLYNLTPLFYDEYSPRLIRHIFGKYYDLNTAIAEQNKIRQLGITDAFVIAYSNGEKINVNQARTLLDNIDISQRTEMQYEIPQKTQEVINHQPIVREEAKKVQEETPKITYFIQIGAFRTEPNSIIKDFFTKLKGNKNLYRHHNNDIIVFRIGSFDKFEDASNKLISVKNSGVTDAFIVAFNNGKRVDIAEAKSLE